jgi:hypothetical protein
MDSGEYASLDALARQFKVSRARVTQVMNLLRLSPEVIEIIYSLGGPIIGPIIAERKLRPLLGLVTEKQIELVKIVLQKCEHKSNQ